MALGKKGDRQARLAEHRRYWDEERETMSPRDRERLILGRLQEQLEYVYQTLPFYRRHYDEHGFRPSMVRSLEDFTTKVPVITKKLLIEDQAQHPPFGSYLGASRSELIHIHGSSGTSGRPTMYGVSAQDWERAGLMGAMGLWCAGIRPGDVVQILFPFGLFFGGWGVLQAVERLGACAFPTGAVGTERQWELLRRISADVLFGTPSYVAHLGMQAAEFGHEAQGSSVSLAVVAGEPGGSIASVRARLRALWGDITLIDSGPGSTSEMYPFISSIGCTEQEGGVHLFLDENYTEVVAKDDPNAPVPPGVSGAAVSTHLWRRSQPMIRFWTGDETVLDDSPCPCGRTYPRLPKGVYGRLDDMLLIRGANVYPSAVEAVIRDTPGCGTEFRIVVEQRGELDEMSLDVERAADLSPDRVAELGRALEANLKARLSIRVPVRIVDPGTHELQTFKAKRVIDRRPARQ